MNPDGAGRVLCAAHVAAPMPMGDASLDLEDVASDGEDGPPQALAGSISAGWTCWRKWPRLSSAHTRTGLPGHRHWRLPDGQCADARNSRG
jgi:hypothetical protein